MPFTSAESITPVSDFGGNPGGIEMYQYIPGNMPAHAPLVVSLHGCFQDAETYSNVGWKALADTWKFYLIFPQQKPSNNAYRCWNWFQANEIERGRGEIKSIIQMIEKMQTDFSIDERRIYIEGLSAGGWMVPVLLASYPDIFAGGATHAGGPAFCGRTEKYIWDVFGWWNLYFGSTTSRQCMYGIDKSPDEWGELVRNNGYGEYAGKWPIISIWHGNADTMVNPVNQQELVDQWTNVHGIDQIADQEDKLGPYSSILHRGYRGNDNTVLVETYFIPGMGHGTPITVDPKHRCGEEGKYILNERICAVRRIGLFWGLDQ